MTHLLRWGLLSSADIDQARLEPLRQLAHTGQVVRMGV